MGKLTDRQRQVFTLVMQGKTQRQIARELHITPRTVQAHYADIRQRTNSQSMIEAAAKLLHTSQTA